MAHVTVIFIPGRQSITASQSVNIWYVSDFGSDDNNCHSASAPCRNLQTILDRAIDGADIYVTSNTLSLDFVINHNFWMIGMDMLIHVLLTAFYPTH